ncbi:MAG: hypothetical protein DHS20C01_37800 [marine bacterium B5-7]|nr:MAG: hypothetical protein DHS20C01_37800 [marine bacterium B5-7]
MPKPSDRTYTSREIADLCNITYSVARRRLLSIQPCRSEKTRGGKVSHYRFEDLPEDVQKRIDSAEAIARLKAENQAIEEDYARSMHEAGTKLGETLQKDEQARLDRITEGRKKFAALPKDSEKRRRAEAKRWLLNEFAQHHRALGGTKRAAKLDFVMRVNADGVQMPEWVSEKIPQYAGQKSLSEGTLQRWGDKYHHHGIWGLVDGFGSRSGKFKVLENKALYKLVLGAMVKNPHIKAKRIIEYLNAEHPSLLIVSERRLHAFMEWWKSENEQIWTYITNPDRWKNVYMAAAGSAFDRVERLNQVWELDSTPGDWLLTDGRHSVVAAIDLCSRRMKFFVSKTSTAAAVKQLLRRCILAWGMCEKARTDNGAEYVGEEVVRLLMDLGIAHEICIPFASEEKGTVERGIQTALHGLLELLPGFIGHSVADRKVIEARKSFAERVMKRGGVVEVSISSVELQQKLDEWSDLIYAHNPHSGLKGKTPWEVANAWAQPIRVISDPHALDELLAEVAGERTITKKGLRYDNRFFIDPTGRMHEYVGEKVTIRIDEQDIGHVAVYMDGAFLCWAADPDVTGIDRQEAARAIKYHTRRVVAEKSKELKGYAKSLKQNIPQAVIDHRKAQVENLIELPKRNVEHSTPALEQAAAAAACRRNRGEDFSRSGDVEFLYDTPEDRYQHAINLSERLAQRELVTTQDRRWLEGYRYTEEYELMRDAEAARNDRHLGLAVAQGLTAFRSQSLDRPFRDDHEN